MTVTASYPNPSSERATVGVLPSEFRLDGNAPPVDTSPVRVLVAVDSDAVLDGVTSPWVVRVTVDHSLGDGRVRAGSADFLADIERRGLAILDELEGALAGRQVRALWTFRLRSGAWADITGRAGLRAWVEDPRCAGIRDSEEEPGRLELPNHLWGF